ncbi:MAG: MmcQ/YjbR family DNA-binding protein [Rhizobiaceae bacterium]
MVSREEFAALALACPGATARPHFDRTAYRTRRIFVTLAADGLSANVKLSVDDQALRCALHPESLAPVPNKFGDHGWTTIDLGRADRALVESLLADAARDASRK